MLALSFSICSAGCCFAFRSYGVSESTATSTIAVVFAIAFSFSVLQVGLHQELQKVVLRRVPCWADVLDLPVLF